jgi:hypothetical protein
MLSVRLEPKFINKMKRRPERYLSSWKVNFSDGALEHMSKRYLFTTGEKKITYVVRCKVYCAWAVASSRKLGQAIVVLLKHYFYQNLLKICRVCNKMYLRNLWNTLLIQFINISHNFQGKVSQPTILGRLLSVPAFARISENFLTLEFAMALLVLHLPLPAEGASFNLYLRVFSSLLSFFFLKECTQPGTLWYEYAASHTSGNTACLFKNSESAVLAKKIYFQLKRYLFNPHKTSKIRAMHQLCSTIILYTSLSRREGAQTATSGTKISIYGQVFIKMWWS